jgi:hypothetical protein
MAVAPDLRPRTLLVDEGIVLRDLAVWRDADDLAVVEGKVLRLITRAEVIAERDEQVSIRRLRNAAAVIVPAALAPLLEDDLYVAERRIASSFARATATRPPRSALKVR